MSETKIEGRCHCGNISFTLQPMEECQTFAIRNCGCSFCGPRTASWTSIPDARLEIAFRVPALVSRYTFATHTAVFHVCARCGAVPISTSEIDGRIYAEINVSTLTVPVLGIVRNGHDLASETLAARLTRRKHSWIADVCFARQAVLSRPFTIQRAVLFGDCDPGGVIYSPRVADFVVEAAMEFVSDRLGAPAARSASPPRTGMHRRRNPAASRRTGRFASRAGRVVR